MKMTRISFAIPLAILFSACGVEVPRHENKIISPLIIRPKVSWKLESIRYTRDEKASDERDEDLTLKETVRKSAEEAARDRAQKEIGAAVGTKNTVAGAYTVTSVGGGARLEGRHQIDIGARFSYKKDKIRDEATKAFLETETGKSVQSHSKIFKSDWKLRFDLIIRNETTTRSFKYDATNALIYLNVSGLSEPGHRPKSYRIDVPVRDKFELNPRSELNPKRGLVILGNQTIDVSDAKLREILFALDVLGKLEDHITIDFDDRFPLLDGTSVADLKGNGEINPLVIGVDFGKDLESKFPFTIATSHGNGKQDVTYREALNAVSSELPEDYTFKYSLNNSLEKVLGKPFGQPERDDKGIYMVMVRMNKAEIMDSFSREELDSVPPIDCENRELFFTRVDITDIAFFPENYPTSALNKCLAYLDERVDLLNSEELFYGALLALKKGDEKKAMNRYIMRIPDQDFRHFFKTSGDLKEVFSLAINSCNDTRDLDKIWCHVDGKRKSLKDDIEEGMKSESNSLANTNKVDDAKNTDSDAQREKSKRMEEEIKNLRLEEDERFIHSAIRRDDAEIFAYLYQKSFKSAKDRSVLGIAAEQGSINVVKWLFTNCPQDQFVQSEEINKVDDTHKRKRTPLVYAAIGGHLDVCQYLCGKGADFNYIFKNDKKWQIDELGNERYNTNAVTRDYINALRTIEKIRGGNFSKRGYPKNVSDSLIKEWVTAGVSPNYELGAAWGRGGSWSLYSWAVVAQKDDLVDWLIEHGADVHDKTRPEPSRKSELHGYTALMLAAEKGNTNLIAKLLKRGVKRNVVRGDSGMTALHYAIKANKIEAMKMLMEGTDLSRIGAVSGEWRKMNIWQYIATYLKDADMLEQFFRDDNAREADEYGYTPLMYAAHAGNVKAVMCLVNDKHNAKYRDYIELRTKTRWGEGETALDIARGAKMDNVVKIIDAVTNGTPTILIELMMDDQILEDGVTVKIGDSSWTTPIIWGKDNIKEGVSYGGKVLYERAGKHYVGTLETFFVNWKGLAVIKPPVKLKQSDGAENQE